MSALDDFVKAVKDKAKAPAEGGPAATSKAPQVRSRWTYESVVYLVTETHCACGAHSRQTNPYPLIRRFHPKLGMHEEAIALGAGASGHATLPVSMDTRFVQLQNCHECLSEHTPNPCAQGDLFNDSETL